MKESNQAQARKLLKPYRIKIDALDDQIVRLLSARFGVVRKIAKIKIKHDLPSFLHDRVVEVRDRNVKRAKKYGIDPAFIYNLYSAIIYQSCGVEDELRKKPRKKRSRPKPPA